MKKLLLILLSLCFFSVSFSQVGRLNLLPVRMPANVPTIFINPSFLPDFSTPAGTASASQSVAVTGVLLTANITVTAPSSFEVSTDNVSFGTTKTITESGGNASGTIYVRVASSATVGSKSGNVTFASTGATTQNCAVTATVTSTGPTITVSVASLSGFSTIVGNQSASQSYLVSGSALTANLVINAPANFVISTDNSNFFTSLTLIPSGGTVNSTPIFVAISSSAPVGSPSGNVANTSTGATTKNVSVSGTVSSASVVDTVKARFNMDSTNLSVSGWKDANPEPGHAQVVVTDNITSSYQQVTISTVSGKWTGIGSGARAASNTQGISLSTSDFDPAVGISYWYNFVAAWLGNPTPADSNLVISGLDPTQLYSIEAVGAKPSAGISCPTGRIMAMYVWDSTNNRIDSAYLNVKGNTTNTMLFINKVPDATGRIKIAITPKAGGTSGNCSQYGYLNGMIVTKQAQRDGMEWWLMIALIPNLFMFNKKRMHKGVMLAGLLFSSIACFSQDSTLSEKRDPVYHVQRKAIIQPFKIIVDSVKNSQPNWTDSIKFYSAQNLNSNQQKISLFNQKINAQKELLRSLWCPFAKKLEQLNQSQHVVGDLKAQCLLSL